MNETLLNRPKGRITAILGPTNTGKTHLAVERLCGHRTGMIGLPLRLLAREIYDRVVAEKGARQVALITGEEKILPANPNYYVCTVESMPLDIKVDFLAVDEIQLCDDFDRGHVFTDRLLHMRGLEETMFLGADTIRPLLSRLVEGVEFISRPRFSELRYAGEKKISRLPRRTAIVAFSATDVYTIAELIRRQRGGAAVVMGALSPRTRNAQVALYQAGEVDYLVATDAIGMGLNMNVDHVAFAGKRKFDGIAHRHLAAAEIGQIAGRAGRYLNDGSFGTSAGLGTFDQDLVEMVEHHRFDPLHKLQWRSRDLDYRSPKALLASLRQRPEHKDLLLARDNEDVSALRTLSADPDIAALLQGRISVSKLWDVCRIPDFRKNMPDNHHRMLKQIFLHLMNDAGVLPEDWIAPLVQHLDNIQGDVDTLATRIAFVRTWTYVANRANWLQDPAYWRARTSEVEDRLSDALHAALTQRFVDRRTALLFRKLKDSQELLGAVNSDGEVLVEGQFVGRLRGLRFEPDKARTGGDGGVESRAIRAAANRVLVREVERIATQLLRSEHQDFQWRDDNRLYWRGAAVARLGSGPDILHPDVMLDHADHLTGPLREKVRQRLLRMVAEETGRLMLPLMADLEGQIGSAARGIWYQLREGLGNLPRQQAAELIPQLTDADRAAFRKQGLRLGYVDLFLPVMLKPERINLNARLWQAFTRPRPKQPEPPAAPAPGLVSVKMVDPLAMPATISFYRACGFRICGDRAIRMDILDRLADMARRAAANGPFAADHEMLSLAGCGDKDITVFLKVLGYKGRPAPSLEPIGAGENETSDNTDQPPKQFYRPASRRKSQNNRSAKSAKTSNQRVGPRAGCSPFAVLGELKKRV